MLYVLSAPPLNCASVSSFSFIIAPVASTIVMELPVSMMARLASVNFRLFALMFAPVASYSPVRVAPFPPSANVISPRVISSTFFLIAKKVSLAPLSVSLIPPCLCPATAISFRLSLNASPFPYLFVPSIFSKVKNPDDAVRISLDAPAASSGRFVMLFVLTVTPAAFLFQPVGTAEVVVPSHPARFTLSRIMPVAV